MAKKIKIKLVSYQNESVLLKRCRHKHNSEQNIKLSALYASVILMAVLFCFSIVKAGSLNPSSTPAATMYTLQDIYTRLTTNSTAGTHNLGPSASPASTMYTLTQIYDAVPTIDATKVKLGTAYLGVDGTLVPSGGTATTANVLFGQTFFGDSQTNWTLQTGTMTNVGAQTITPTTTNTTITAGYHNGSGYCAGDADLVTGNIRSGVNIFGIDGNSNVVNTATGTAEAGDILSGKIAWVDGSEITGNVTAGSNVAGNNGSLSMTIPDALYSSSKTCTASDTNLSAGNIKSGTAIFGVTGTFPSDGTAGTGDVLSGQTFYNTSGTKQTGTMTDKSATDSASSAQTAAVGVNYFTVPANGYYNTSSRISATDAQVAALDADLTAENIASGTTIFGVLGTLSAGSSYGLPKTGQTTSYVDYDDGYYQKGTPAAPQARFTDNGDGTITDNGTGLMWVQDPSTCSGTGFDFSGTYYWADAITAITAMNTAVKYGYSDWRLPNVKELISIVDYGRSFPAIDPLFTSESNQYWSSTTAADITDSAWVVSFVNGLVGFGTKADPSYYVRPVRGG